MEMRTWRLCEHANSGRKCAFVTTYFLSVALARKQKSQRHGGHETTRRTDSLVSDTPCELARPVRDDDVGARALDRGQRFAHGTRFIDPAQLSRGLDGGVLA